MIDLNAEWLLPRVGRSIRFRKMVMFVASCAVEGRVWGNFARCGEIRKPSIFVSTLWRDNRGYAIPIHRLVALAFLGSPPSKEHVVAHCDGSRDNNHPWNLRWATQKENVSDTFLHGTHNRGARNGQAKLNEDRVLHILSLAAQGMPRRDLAQTFGVCRQAVDDIINGRRWRHVGSEHRLEYGKARVAIDYRQGRGLTETEQGATTTLPASTEDPLRATVAEVNGEGA